MAPSKPSPLHGRILDAAEHLLRQGRTDFSMRDLAAEAEVSFATPFNRFGSKAGIMRALSGLRIDRMEARYALERPPAAAIDRVRLAVHIASAVMLEEPAVNKTVMGWLGAPFPDAGQVLARSTAFWARALEDDGTRPGGDLPKKLAFAFRGVLSFWTAGELPDDALAPTAWSLADAVMRGEAAAD